MDYKLIDNIDMDGIDYSDYPDFCNAFICAADYDGEPMNQDQLDIINEDRDFVYACVESYIY